MVAGHSAAPAASCSQRLTKEEENLSPGTRSVNIRGIRGAVKTLLQRFATPAIKVPTATEACIIPLFYSL